MADLFQLKSSRSKVVRLESELQTLRSQCSEAQTQVEWILLKAASCRGVFFSTCTHTQGLCLY